jgi:hypothetical protein
MQGDVASIIEELVKKLQINTAAATNSQQMIESYIEDVIDSYNKAIEQKNDMYRWNAKTESLWGYFKRVQEQKHKIYKERQKRKENIAFLEDQINLYKEKENDAINSHKKELGNEIFKRRVQLEIEKDIKEAMDDVADTVETGAKSRNPYLAAILIGVGLVIDAAKMLFRIAKSIITIGFSLLTDALGADMGIGAVFRKFLEMQKLVGKVSADSGLIASEARKFLEDMPTIMNEVLDVGGSIEQIGEAYEAYNRLTNRNRVFTGGEFKSIIELGLGTGLGVDAAGELIGNFENLGLSLDKTLKFTDFVRGKAMAVSQNQTKVLKKVSETIIELTGFGIEKGLEGMTKLVIKTEKLRIDAKKSVSAFKDVFTDPEKAVETAGTARLLGGKFALFFSNPFNLMGESMDDPAALVEKLIESIKGKAYKTKNGFQIDAADRELIRQFAKTFDQDADQLFNAAIEDAKYSDKIEALTKRGIIGLSDEQKDLVTNLMTMNEDGSYSIRLSNGVVQRLSETPSNTEIFKTIQQERKNEESALLRKTLQERLLIVLDRFNIGFSQFFVELDKVFNNHNTINDLDSLAKDVSTGTMEFIRESFNGPFGKMVKDGFIAIKDIFQKTFSIFTDPNKELGQKILEFGKYMVDLFDINIWPWLRYFNGALIKELGKKFLSESMEGYGLKMQNKAVLSAGENSMLANNLSELIKETKDYNSSYGANIDVSKLYDLQKKIDESNKKLDKNKNQLNGLTIQPSFMNYGAKMSNTTVPYRNDVNLSPLPDIPRPTIFANEQIIQGRKDDALLFFDEKATQMAVVKKPVVNINLVGSIDLTKHNLDNDGINNAKILTSKQIIGQLANNTV